MPPTTASPADLYRRRLRLLLNKDIAAWVDLWAEDRTMEFPFAPPGRPPRGRRPGGNTPRPTCAAHPLKDGERSDSSAEQAIRRGTALCVIRQPPAEPTRIRLTVLSRPAIIGR